MVVVNKLYAIDHILLYRPFDTAMHISGRAYYGFLPGFEPGNIYRELQDFLMARFTGNFMSSLGNSLNEFINAHIIFSST